MNKIKNFFRLLYLRIRGPEYRIGQVVPYYGGATQIVAKGWNSEHGWMYKFAHSDWADFSESLVTFYLDNPNKDGRSYGYRNQR